MHALQEHPAQAEVASPASHRTSRADLLALILSLLVIAIICLGQSGMKLLWYDELITFDIAHLPTLGAIFHFFESGKDTTSFLPAMLVHGFLKLRGPAEITTRLPSIFAYLVTCLCVWIFAYRRYAAGYGTAAVMLLAQGWTLYFASEERAYAFVVMATAVALVCWQAATGPTRRAGWWTLGVFLALSTAILFHFFAIFLVPAFLAAEIYLYRSTRRVRWSMVAAIVLYPAALAIMLPNMLAARKTYGGTFWSKPSLGLLTDNYVSFFDPVSHNFPELILIIAFAFWAGRRALRSAGKSVRSGYAGFSRPEWVLLIAISLVPFFSYIGALYLGLYRTQYVLFFQLGALMIVIGALAETMRQHARAGLVLAMVLLLTMLMHDRDRFTQGLRILAGKPTTTALYSEVQPDMMVYLKDQTLPLVAEGADSFMILDHYAPQLRGRMVVLTDHQRAAAESHAMTNELNMEIFGKDLHLPTQPFNDFVAAHPDFLLIVNPEQIGFDWVFRSIVEHEAVHGRATVSLVWVSDSGNGDNIYRVHMGAPQ